MPIDLSNVEWDDAKPNANAKKAKGAAPTKIDLSNVEWDAPHAAPSFNTPLTVPAPTKPEATASQKALDTANAAGTGAWRGILSDAAGLPVDTVANAVDLVKAALGSGYTYATGKTPDALQLTDRKNVKGSSAWLLDKLRQNELTKFLVDPQNPDYEGGYAQSMGRVVPAALVGARTPLQATNSVVNSTASAAAAKAVLDATDNPTLALAASFLPGGTQQLAVGGTKQAVRGGEPGRREMAQRVQDLQNAGVENPTLGLASGNKAIERLEDILSNTPGGVGVITKARDAAVNQLADKTGEAAAAASPNRGAIAAGTAVQNGLRSFKDDFKAKQEALYNALAAEIGPETPATVGNTRQTLDALNADIPGAPLMSKEFRNQRIQGIQNALEGDAQATNSLPFEAVKKARTLVGKELADNSLITDVPKSDWKQLYRAMSEDIATTAEQHGDAAKRASDRANDYTRAGMERLERVAPFANKDTPEQAYKAVANTANENISTLQAVKKSLPADARGSVAGTVIERLGKAPNGVQNDTGSAWSPETFLSNWNKLSDKGRDELFSGFANADQVKADVEAVAKAASMMRGGSKMWKQADGLSPVQQYGLPAALGAGMAGMHYLGPVKAAGIAAASLGGTYAGAKAVTSKNVLASMLRGNTYDPATERAAINALIGAGYLKDSNDDKK